MSSLENKKLQIDRLREHECLPTSPVGFAEIVTTNSDIKQNTDRIMLVCNTGLLQIYKTVTKL